MSHAGESVLFIGIGGGNDVFSAVLAAMALKSCGAHFRRYDVAGVLSPFHRHEAEPTPHEHVKRITSKSARYLLRKGDEQRIPFVDARVAAMVERCEIDAMQVLGLPCTGSSFVAPMLYSLSEDYDRIILVDVGGDVFSREGDTVLSPMFDAIMLDAARQLKRETGVQTELFVTGFGTDGEIATDRFHERLARYKDDRGRLRNSGPLGYGVLQEWERLFQRYVAELRPGNTVPNLLRAARSESERLTVTVRARQQLGKRRWHKPLEQHIDTALARRFLLIDPTEIENPFAVDCSTACDWFMQTQAGKRHTNNEANMQYLPQPNGTVDQLLTPSPLFGEGERREMLDAGLGELERGICDKVYMFAEDWRSREKQWQRLFKAKEYYSMLWITRK